MLRRPLLLVPGLAALGPVLAWLLPEHRAGAVALAAGLGIVVALTLEVGRIEGARRLERSLARRFDEIAGERHRIGRLLDRLPLAVLLFADRRLAYANPAASELFEGAVAGRDIAAALGSRSLADAVAEARETGRTVRLELERRQRVLDVRALVTAGGEVALVVHDLSDVRRVEAMRRDFVTNASHELKTPVAAIQALAESLAVAVSRDPDRAAQMAQRLEGEAARLSQLVRDLLDLARLEEEAAQPADRQDLAAIVREQLAAAAPLARARAVSLSADVPPEAHLVGVAADLRLIVANLLENAIRYNREGGTVDVRLVREGGNVMLEVVDTGLGIPEADRSRVFERFYRVDRARSRAAGGTGLGLALVRHAVQRHGGEVWVADTSGRGSTLQVRLPVEGAGQG